MNGHVMPTDPCRTYPWTVVVWHGADPGRVMMRARVMPGEHTRAPLRGVGRGRMPP